ncbi:serine hydrolase [Peribacillus saganii]|uniref:Serine hydrolase n=1 Tax=Peribacillus saganii TaxID=2303992 RepID=A0A372LRU5_9BACI|nr:serine hydrolase [Peribacillus saganii]RFU70925.1 serine hydrolase [Peribacillus saganii]
MNIVELENAILSEIDKCTGRVGLYLEMEAGKIEYNSEEAFRSASLIKVPILIEGYRQKETGRIHLNQPVTVQRRDKVGGSGVLQALSEKSFMTLKDIMTLMIIVSDNTATNVMIDLLGMGPINHSIKELGLTKTVLERKMMDFQAAEQGKDNLTCAADMVLCLKAIHNAEFVSEDNSKEMLEIMEKQQFLDKLPGMMDLDKAVVAGKTGSLKGIEHDCSVIRYHEKVAYAAVLTDGLQSKEDGRRTITNIGKHIFDYLCQ